MFDQASHSFSKPIFRGGSYNKKNAMHFANKMNYVNALKRKLLITSAQNIIYG